MPFRGSHSASAVPPTLQKRHEIMQAICTLAAQEDEPLRRRRDEIASLRAELTEIALALAELRRVCDPRLRSYVIKYSPDQPRVPAGNLDGGQWTRIGHYGLVKARPDDPQHPGWPAGTPGGIGGQFRPKDGESSTDPAETLNSGAKRGEQFAASDESPDAANDNLTPEQTCQRAYADAVASIRINPSLGPPEYLKELQESASSLDWCLGLASGERPIYRGGNFVEFYGGGWVVFRQGRPPLYVRRQRR